MSPSSLPERPVTGRDVKLNGDGATANSDYAKCKSHGDAAATITNEGATVNSAGVKANGDGAKASGHDSAKVNDKLPDKFIDCPPSLSVAVIGGGLAGILAGIILPAKVPNIQLTIYEKNDELGGTWLENKYPGVRCDIPGHVYQASFAPNRAWTEKFPRGQQVCEYWQKLAADYDVYKYVKLSHKVERLEWQPGDAQWEISLHDTAKDTKSRVRYDFVMTAIGRFNDWQLPKIPGLADFEGVLVHTASWPPGLDVGGKRVAVVGNGSSGIQVLPNIQPIVTKVDHYARSQTWIAPSWAGDAADDPAETGDQPQDPEGYLAFQKELADSYWRRFDSYMRGTEQSKKLREVCAEHMQKTTGDWDYEVPAFPPNCRRLTPGPNYLKSLLEDNVEYIRTPIRQVKRNSIETEDGCERPTDVLICATGFNTDMAPPFPIVSGDADLSRDWKLDGKHGCPFTYLGMAVPGFPNLLVANGPHATGLSGLVPHACEVQLAYMAKLLRKVANEGVRTVVPSLAATEDFCEYVDTFFADSVVGRDCSSWYNGGRAGSRVHGLWPGSAAHGTLARKDPRWEDFEWTHRWPRNRFWGLMGNGRTRREFDAEADMTAYLRLPASVDLRLVHEEWWSFP